MHDWSSFRVVLSHPWTLVAIAVSLCLTVIVGAGLCKASRSARNVSLNESSAESGGLSEELVLAFPFFVLFLAVTIQFILLLNAKVVVNYAAFTAARSASVWIPACYNGEPPNTLRLSSQGPGNGVQLVNAQDTNPSKLDRIRGAAVLAAAPISPSYLAWMRANLRRARIWGFPLPQDLQNLLGPYQRALERADRVFTGEGAAGQALRLLPRWYYSSLFTEVTFAGSERASQATFQPNGDIAVTVEHKFYLNIPFVGRILGKSYGNAGFGIFSSDVYYAPVSETYTIQNEGELLYPRYCGG